MSAQFPSDFDQQAAGYRGEFEHNSYYYSGYDRSHYGGYYGPSGDSTTGGRRQISISRALAGVRWIGGKSGTYRCALTPRRGGAVVLTTSATPL